MVTKICVGDYVGDIYHHAKFYPNRFRGFVSAHAWFRVPLRKVTQLFFFWGGGVLEQGYRRDARTAFDEGTAYVQTTRFCARKCHGGRKTRPPFSPPKNGILGTISTEQNFSPENGFDIGRFESKRPLVVVGAE